MQAIQERTHAAQEENCAACGGQLAVIGGVLVRGMEPGQVAEKEGDGNVAERDLERDAEGKVSDRARRKLYVGCGSCRRPVSLNHFRQLALDRQWAERDAVDRMERDRAAKVPPPATTPYTELNPVRAAEDRIARLEKRSSDDGKRLAAMEAEIASLKQLLATARKQR